MMIKIVALLMSLTSNAPPELLEKLPGLVLWMNTSHFVSFTIKMFLKAWATTALIVNVLYEDKVR